MHSSVSYVSGCRHRAIAIDYGRINAAARIPPGFEPIRACCFRAIVLIAVILGAARLDAQSNLPPVQDPADEVASFIDRHIANLWQRNRVEAAPPSDDPEFLRRTYLNLVGRVPSVNEALEFLDSSSPDRRRDLVDRLLNSPGYLTNYTSFWRTVIIPEANHSGCSVNGRVSSIAQFDIWLRERFERNDGLDRIAREVISGIVEVPSEGNTMAFDCLKECRPDNLAAGTARAFLGIRLECAQCHNHPSAKWRREDFWKLAAFYGNVQGGAADSSNSTGWKIKIPDLDQEVTAAFLDGRSPDARTHPNARVALANWVTNRENAYFAKACVNRLWAHLFGLGIVDPVDDFDERNPPSHPELLDELANAFVLHNYDQKFLLRGITRSRTYQLTSRRTHSSQDNSRLFARMLVKGLSCDELFDSLIWATGNVDSEKDPDGLRLLERRAKYRELFDQKSSAQTEKRTSISHALLMMNGPEVDQATVPGRGRTLSAIIDAPFFNNQQRLETLFLAALARPPRSAEVAMLLKYVEDHSPDRSWKQALGDVFWVLLNTSEFSTNH